MDERTQSLIDECKRQEESCLYTAATLFEWLKSMRRWKLAFVVAPIVLGGVATWPLLARQPDYEWVRATCARLAGFAPAVYKARDFDVSLDVIARHAYEFKILQDRFRQACRITALAPGDAFEKEFSSLMERLDVARSPSLTAPERFFRKAQGKIQSGHYNFSVDG